ncbi:MAG TPA: hypothetical protein VE781_08840 [Kineosporiaceae bacterium]|nr:hypothetical protein [Kineosporiaceae bacterium]
MTRPLRRPGRPAAAALLVAVLAGCAASTSAGGGGVPASGSASGTPAGTGPSLATGPGPQPRYTVHQAPAAGSCRYRYVRSKPLPDPSCTPGAVNPQVTEQTLRSTICRQGYSGDVRPPREVTDREKRLSARAYGYTGSFATAEFDHLVPIGVGGDPNDPRNLWLEPNDVARATDNQNTKDDVESTLHDAVCSGRVRLADAQRAIATDWTTALAVLGLR